MKNKKIIIAIVILAVVIGAIGLQRLFIPKTTRTTNNEQRTTKYWTCGMHPSVRVSDAEYKRGKTSCPICNMPLIPAEDSKTPTTHDSRLTTKEEHVYYGCGVKEEGHCPHCDEGKADEKCVCGGHSVVMQDVEMKCPA